VANILLVTPANQPVGEVPAALAMLPHRVTAISGADRALLQAGGADLFVVDGRGDLAKTHTTVQLLVNAKNLKVLLLVPVVSLPVLSGSWGVDDFVVEDTTAAELDARIRLLLESGTQEASITAGPIAIDEDAYTVTVHGHALDLTYTEFELLKFLMQHPGRVFSREQILADVWGFDYFGGTRTVDVHVRRLRAKLGPELESYITTVRNVGYRFSAVRTDTAA
jgi:DNA-binding response OmpR family regulator